MDNAPDPSTVLLLILLAGAFGGVAELLRECGYQSGMITLYGSQCNASSSLVIMLIASAIIGAAGAMGIQFIFVLLKSTRSRPRAKAFDKALGGDRSGFVSPRPRGAGRTLGTESGAEMALMTTNLLASSVRV